MYKIDDLVVYGKMGVCKVKDIASLKNPEACTDRLYYVIQPMNDNCVIYAPVDTKAFMRPVISAGEANRLINGIQDVRVEAYFNDRAQDLAQHYENVIKSHDCEGLIKLVMSIYNKKMIMEQQNHKFGQIDERYMKQAEELLFSEFAVALGIPKEKVPQYIESKVHLDTIQN